MIYTHTHTHIHSVVLPWTRDRPVAETSTWQRTTYTGERYSWSQVDPKSQSHQANGRRPTPFDRVSTNKGVCNLINSIFYGSKLKSIIKKILPISHIWKTTLTNCRCHLGNSRSSTDKEMVPLTWQQMLRVLASIILLTIAKWWGDINGEGKCQRKNGNKRTTTNTISLHHDINSVLSCALLWTLLLLLLLSLSPLYSVSTRMSPRQIMSLVDPLLQLLFRFIFNTVSGAYLPRSYVGSDGLIRQHYPGNVCSA